MLLSSSHPLSQIIISKTRYFIKFTTSNFLSRTTSKLLLFSNLAPASSETNRSTLVGGMGFGLCLLLGAVGLVAVFFPLAALVGFLGAMVRMYNRFGDLVELVMV